MGTLRQARGLGAIGSVLMLLAPLTLGLLLVPGLVLVLVAVKYIGEVIRKGDLYGDMAIAVALAIISQIVGYYFILSGAVSITGLGSTATGTDPLSLYWTFITRIYLVLAAVWILLFLAAPFVKKSFESIATSLDEKLFDTVGILYAIGAGLIIVLGIGFIILYAAIILQAAAFLSLPDEKPLLERPGGQ